MPCSVLASHGTCRIDWRELAWAMDGGNEMYAGTKDEALVWEWLRWGSGCVVHLAFSSSIGRGRHHQTRPGVHDVTPEGQ